jgi:hypothetical protein
MEKRYALRFGIMSLAVLAMVTFAPWASASALGELTFANCSGDGVTVTLTTVDWLPVGAGTGCIDAGAGTTVTFTGGSITPGEAGTVNDLSFGSGNTDFIQFAGIKFSAQTVGPGVANTVCANTYNPADAACSISSTSPFVLTPGTTGTTVTLSVSGYTDDASQNPWSGVFSTQIAGKDPLDIERIINGSGSVTATYSFDGEVGVPEPVSMALLGGGLIALAGLKRWKS